MYWILRAGSSAGVNWQSPGSSWEESPDPQLMQITVKLGNVTKKTFCNKPCTQSCSGRKKSLVYFNHRMTLRHSHVVAMKREMQSKGRDEAVTAQQAQVRVWLERGALFCSPRNGKDKLKQEPSKVLMRWTRRGRPVLGEETGREELRKPMADISAYKYVIGKN